MRAFLVVALALGLALNLACPPDALAEATIRDIIVTNTRDDLLAYLAVEGCFTPEMKEAVLSGVPTTFTFFVELYRVRDFWPDLRLASLHIDHTLKYDSLKGVYWVTLREQGHEAQAVRDMARACRLMSELNGVKVAPLSRLQKGASYRLRVKAKLSKVRLPLYLHYVLFFVSLWDFETDWYSVDFTY
jgi:hypothetical protein